MRPKQPSAGETVPATAMSNISAGILGSPMGAMLGHNGSSASLNNIGHSPHSLPLSHANTQSTLHPAFPNGYTHQTGHVYQNGYLFQNGITPQNRHLYQNGLSPSDGHSPQNGCVLQNGHSPQSRPSSQAMHSPQNGQSPQSRHSSQSVHSSQSGRSPQGGLSSQHGHSPQNTGLRPQTTSLDISPYANEHSGPHSGHPHQNRHAQSNRHLTD